MLGVCTWDRSVDLPTGWQVPESTARPPCTVVMAGQIVCVSDAVRKVNQSDLLQIGRLIFLRPFEFV
jgi:hypothetical protein